MSVARRLGGHLDQSRGPVGARPHRRPCGAIRSARRTSSTGSARRLHGAGTVARQVDRYPRSTRTATTPARCGRDADACPGPGSPCTPTPTTPRSSCGGTLARWVDERRGGPPGRGEPGREGLDRPRSRPGRARRRPAVEVAEAAAVLGLASFELLGYPDGESENDLDAARATGRGRAPPAARRGGVPRPDCAVLRRRLREPPRPPRRAGSRCSTRWHRPRRARSTSPSLGPPHQVAPGVPLGHARTPTPAIDIGAGARPQVAAPCACHRSQVGEAREWVSELVGAARPRTRAVSSACATRRCSGSCAWREVGAVRWAGSAAVAELAPLAHGPQPEDRDDGGARGGRHRPDVGADGGCHVAGRRSVWSEMNAQPISPPASPPSRMATKATARATGEGSAERAWRGLGGRAADRTRPC